MQTKFVIRNMKAVNDYIKTVPYGAVKVGLKAFVDYILGDASHGLRHDEPQRYVSRAAAGYTTSQKQMRYFFAVGILENDGSGGIKLNHYTRTGETAAAWKANPTNSGYGWTLVNNKDGAYWTRAEDGQTTQHAMAGRRKISAVIADNFLGATRHMIAEVKKFLGNQ